MRILVTGSRDWDDWVTIEMALRQVAEGHSWQDVTLVHGGARGADSIAAFYAQMFTWKIEVHQADWEKHGKAGPIRNREMVEAGADVCLAFIKDNSLGASHCARLAEKAGIPVKRYRA